jgi:hypothetical protein
VVWYQGFCPTEANWQRKGFRVSSDGSVSIAATKDLPPLPTKARDKILENQQLNKEQWRMGLEKCRR